jgi:hypothetical protein
MKGGGHAASRSWIAPLTTNSARPVGNGFSLLDMPSIKAGSEVDGAGYERTGTRATDMVLPIVAGAALTAVVVVPVRARVRA